MRTLFTLGSVALIMLLYTVLTSVVNSFSNQIENVITRQKVDIVIQDKFAVSPVTSSISYQTIKKIETNYNIESSQGLLIGRIRLNGRTPVFILGVTNTQILFKQVGIDITEGNAAKQSNEIIVGVKMAKLSSLKVGDTIELKSGKNYKISGIYESWLNFINSGVIMNMKNAQILLKREKEVSLLFLSLKDPQNVKKIVKKINTDFPKMRAVESQKLPDFMGKAKTIFYLSEIVSIITLIIAAAILLNTFIMATSERIKEIGILKTIGWSEKMITSIFLIESLLLAFSGALLGYFASFPTLYILQNKFPSIATYLPTSPSLIVFGNILFLSLIVSIISIIFPAYISKQLNIAEALRHE
jgi:ABC-type lipoprotein release transport system permease subunit